jgi:hypothetical protein
MDDGYGCGVAITGLLVFFGIWIGCAVEYGFLGFALGWMPAAIIGWICGMLWPLLLLVIIVGALILFAFAR